MSTIDHPTQTQLTEAQLDGVRTARVMAFFIDYLIIILLSVPFAIIVFVLGILTLGLAWGLYAVLLPFTALLYLGLTMGGPQQSTIGMRMMGVKIFRMDGEQVGFLFAALHGILFWFIHFTVFLLLVSFFSRNKRLLHDVLLGTYVARD